jgi:hypothetical protein
MIKETETIKCESIFSDDRNHRYLWKRVWHKDKPLAAIIMLNPCHSDNIITDTTTALVVNNIARLEDYGGVVILNMYSKLTNKLVFRWNSDDDLNTSENDSYILKAAEECSDVIIAWGKSENTNQRIATRAEQVIQLLSPYAEKLKVITDGKRSLLHPLTPSLRSAWHLKSWSDYKKECSTESDK